MNEPQRHKEHKGIKERSLIPNSSILHFGMNEPQRHKEHKGVKERAATLVP
ncbi:MAG: hypothetical protein F6K31_08670 [Symploca sp. SIO2G7]|nr:hypothetical protein [Symploca sp. SIO2G7]